MQRLVKDAAKIDKSVKSNDMSYANIVKAIHAVQENMGIMGTTAKEANFTIQGSLSSMKAAWGNLLPALIKGGDEFDQCVNNLIESIVGVKDESGKMVGGVINNLLPAVEKSLGGIGTLIERVAPIIEKCMPELVDRILPPLIKAGTSLFVGLVKALPNIVKVLIDEIPNVVKQIRKGLVDAFGKDSLVIGVFDGLVEGFIWLKDTGIEAFKKLTGVLDWVKAHFETIKKVAVSVALAIGSVVVAVKSFKAVQSVISLFSVLGKSGGTAKGSKILKEIANMKVTTVLKGMANLAIIIGGMTAIAAALMLVAPYMAQLSDFKSIFKVVAVIGVVAVLGTALTFLASKIGKIPVKTVALGLANIAIALGGFGALAAVFLWLAPYMAALGDMQSIIKVSIVMGILGTLGTTLSVLAGIVGMIPFPVVVSGLSNMATVLGGMSAIVVAFGALQKIDGFNKLIAGGGKVLVTLCDIIGKMVGSLVGGAVAKMSEALPTLGKNLGTFGTNIKPLFSSMQGVDMGGVGAFFTSLVGLLGIATGNEIVEGIKSFFGGDEESSLAKLGTQLSDFATNSKTFFTSVAELPENGFANATKMFSCLGGIKSLPKEGGVVGWFSGEVNYTTLSSGLASLSNENVSGFFAFTAGLKQAGFDMATALFDCLAGLKSLPKDGGVVGWFSGEVNYSNIASGLGSLAGEGVKNFFAMVSGLKQAGFDNATKLFKCLAGMGDLTSGDGFWERLKDGIFGGDDDKTMLSTIADGLSDFASKAGTFFELVNSLRVDNLNALFDALNKLSKATVDLKNTVTSEFDKIASTISKKCTEITTGLNSSGSRMMESLARGIVSKKSVVVSAITTITDAINKKINSTISGGNWALKEFGSDTRLSAYRYANGTGGHKGGNAIVNDGRGAELVQMPNGNTFIPNGRNVFLPNAPKGMRVLDADKTAKLFGKKNPTFRYADGTGDIDVFSFDDGKGLADALVKKFSGTSGMKGYALSAGTAAVSTVKKAMSGWGDKLIKEFGAAGLEDYVASGGVEQWRSTVIRALKMEGEYSAANVKRTLYQMQTESGGNPRAINNWDSNAKKGTPSKGLMQVIDPTFKAYARKGYDKNINDPLSNILASVRYAKSRYGSLAKAYQGHGYSNGVGESGIRLPQYSPESSSVRTTNNSNTVNTFSPQFTLNMNGASATESNKRKIKRWVKESINETFESMSRVNPELCDA